MHRELKTRAEVHGRSLNKEIIATLDQSIHSSVIDAHAVSARAQAVRESLAIYMTQKDLDRLKNEGRK